MRAGDGEQGARARPDLIHASVVPRKGLAFRCIEVKYRRHLRTARAPELLRKYGGTDEYVATAQQERMLIDRIKQMNRFKALYFCEGKRRPAPVRLRSLD